MNDRQQRPFAAYRLPHGRHGLSRDLIAENQRWRLLGAAAEVFGERGYARVTSIEIASAAGVSSSTFYRYFDDVSDCLFAAYEVAVACVWEAVSGACKESGDWPSRLRDALDAALGFLSAEPAMAELLGTPAPVGVPAITAARIKLVGRLAALLASGRAERLADSPSLPADIERHLIGGVFALVSTRIAKGETAQLSGLTPELAEVLGAPYMDMGHAARTG